LRVLQFNETAKVAKETIFVKCKIAKITKILNKTETICLPGGGGDKMIRFQFKFSVEKFSRNEFCHFVKYRAHFVKLHVFQNNNFHEMKRNKMRKIDCSTKTL
jgi:hypothetical protein